MNYFMNLLNLHIEAAGIKLRRGGGTSMEVEHETAREPLHSVINLNESWDVNRWCEELNLRAEELKEIVKKVGPHVDDVRDYLAHRNLEREAPY